METSPNYGSLDPNQLIAIADQNLTAYIQHLKTAINYQRQLRQRIERYTLCNSLKQAHRAHANNLLPMWPCAPTSEQLISPDGGKNHYLWLYWPRDQGPRINDKPPQKKTYIGRPDSQNANLSRRMIQHRETYRHLTRTEAQLIATLKHHTSAITASTKRLASLLPELIDRHLTEEEDPKP